MVKPPPLPHRWPNYELGEPSTRLVSPRDSALLNIKTMRGISMVIVVLGLLAVFFLSSAPLGRLARDGEVVSARAVSIVNVSHRKRPEEVRVDYRYRFNGEDFERVRSLDKKRFEALAQGEFFPVTVLPSRPSVHEIGRIGEEEVGRARTEGSLIVLGMAAPFALIALGIRLQIRRETKVLGTWRPLPAQVVDIVQTNPRGIEIFVVTYRVRLPNGKVIERNATMDGTQAKRRRVGEFFPVLAPPEKLHRHSPIRPLSSFTMTRLETGPITAGTLSS